jgi:hypothetical protein
MGFTNIWDDTFPPDTQLANLLGLDLRNLRLDTQQRMAAISGLDANKPNFGGDTQAANWSGILYFATDTGKIYQFNYPSWTDVTVQLLSSINNVLYVSGVPVSYNSFQNNPQTIWTIPSLALNAKSVIRINFSISIIAPASMDSTTIFLSIFGQGLILNSIFNSNPTDVINYEVIIWNRGSTNSQFIESNSYSTNSYIPSADGNQTTTANTGVPGNILIQASTSNAFGGTPPNYRFESVLAELL